MNPSGYPYQEAHFDLNGHPLPETNLAAIQEMLEDQIGDLIVFSHGWNNNIAEARDLYEKLLKCARDVQTNTAAGLTEGKKFAVLGLFWPSKRFTDPALIPGGAASVGSTNQAVLKHQLGNLIETSRPEVREALARAQDLLPALAFKQSAKEEFVTLLVKNLLASHDETDAVPHLKTLSAEKLVQRLTPGVDLPTTPNATGGGAAASVLDDVFNFVRNALNLFTYYEMKERAWTVGSTGVANLLTTLKTANPTLKPHLFGHSFGARLLTSSVKSLGDQAQTAGVIQTLMLVQAAYSHYGFAQRYDQENNDGFFRPVISKGYVSGPILVTHTQNDIANGVAYPLASRLAAQTGAALGDANDRYGGIGRNGAQKTPEAVTGRFLALHLPYEFMPGKIHNLLADDVILEHSLIDRPEVLQAFFTACAVTP
jgi:hypothetical protein